MWLQFDAILFSAIETVDAILFQMQNLNFNETKILPYMNFFVKKMF